MKEIIKNLIATLESEPDPLADFVKPVKDIFIPNLEKTYELYERLSGMGKKEGLAIYSRNLVLARSINDLLAGLHLASHGYILQSYTVLRPILESVDMAKLFSKDPSMADIWVEGGEKARNELRPSAVRRKLGKESYDEMYGHFCNYGSHPSFDGSSGMSAMKVGEKKPTVTVWIGGVHNSYAKPRLFLLFGLIFLLQILVISEISKILFQVKEEDSAKDLYFCIDNFEKFSKYLGNELRLKNNPIFEELSSIIEQFKKEFS